MSMPVLAGVSPSAASPSSPAEYFMALFGGNKGKVARTNGGAAWEAELLSAIEAVQGRGRCVCGRTCLCCQIDDRIHTLPPICTYVGIHWKFRWDHTQATSCARS